MVRLAGVEPALRDIRNVFDYPIADSRKLDYQLSSTATRPLGHLWLRLAITILHPAHFTLGLFRRIPDKPRC